MKNEHLLIRVWETTKYPYVFGTHLYTLLVTSKVLLLFHHFGPLFYSLCQLCSICVVLRPWHWSPERQENYPYSYDADIWSLGLTVLHLATGKYPYDLDGGIAGLAFQVVGEPAPTPKSEDRCSTSLTDFVARCLQKDPKLRPSAADLLRHPFVAAAVRGRGIKRDVP